MISDVLRVRSSGFRTLALLRGESQDLRRRVGLATNAACMNVGHNYKSSPLFDSPSPHALCE